MIKKLLLFILLVLPFNVYALSSSEITQESTYTLNDVDVSQNIKDGNVTTSLNLKQNENLLIQNNQNNIKQIYITYETNSKSGTLFSNNGENVSLGSNRFLHEYVSLHSATNSVSLIYNEDVNISEIRIFTDGDTPADIQKWNNISSSGLMLFATHPGDELTLFAGLLPTYINQNKNVHVVYLTKYDTTNALDINKMHEHLNALWELGLTNYPTLGLISNIDSNDIESAKLGIAKSNTVEEDIVNLYVREIRKYKPDVIVGHDENGENNSGQNMLNSYILKNAIEKASDENYILDNTKSYKVPKMYLHLYDDENKTVLNYDTPLEKYSGKTAYQISKEIYLKYTSLQNSDLTKWIAGEDNSYITSSQIETFNPAYYGLYYSNVGNDVSKNDLFENIKTNSITNRNINKSNNSYEKDFVYILDESSNLISVLLGIIIVSCMTIIVILKRRKEELNNKEKVNE